ncbi:type VI secretion system tip protein VgrG [Nitrincola tibetensis]|uniref:Type VI secretion system tip protein VgrG n=2 Tax=Nitrincola tibetensis TaxID=2219697 RepID=A0A364NNL0_9GAMM|nr:type VI secretion system tip protein VgrG [Nitrincola tibetensis]
MNDPLCAEPNRCQLRFSMSISPAKQWVTLMYSQKSRLLAIDTPLGEDAFLLTRIEGEEAMSSLFSFEIELYSERASVKAADIVGQNVTLKIMQTDEEGLKTDAYTFINAHVRRFREEGQQLQNLRSYRADVVPWLWFLTQTSDSKIFQNKDIRQIASEVFADNGFNDFEFRLFGQHPVREYCVQYQESDFTFLSRLFEEEGIYYFFKHEANKHTMILSDHDIGTNVCEEGKVSYRSSGLSEDAIFAWSHQHEFRTGRLVHRDYDFTKPADRLQTFDKAMMDVPGVERFEQFTYPGRYQSKLLGEPLIRLRTEHNEALHDQVFGKSHCRSFRSGHKFELVRHDDAAQELDTYLLVSVQHRAEDYSYTSCDEESRGYENEFVCMPASRVYRPPLKTGWPKMLGPQHAKVVGPEGEEIYTDEYGRVKIQFPWDRYGQNNENSSCWVRVSHQWAGRNWGSIYIPRIGQEVIVDFYDGNPDRPIITGRVYNAEQMPPNSLPANKPRSTIRSKTHKGKGFNEFSFEDEAGNEFIYIHAQKNMEVQVQNSHHKRVEYDDTATIGNNSYLAVAQDRIEKVDQNQHTTIIGNLTEKIDGNQGVTLGGSQHIKVGGDMTYKVSGEIVLDASKITLVSGGASIVITSGGINIAPSINVGSASPGTAAIPSIPEILEVAAGAGSPFVSHCPKTT